MQRIHHMEYLQAEWLRRPLPSLNNFDQITELSTCPLLSFLVFRTDSEPMKTGKVE